MLITLPAGLQDDLKWEMPGTFATDIIWYIDFKFDEKKICLTDSADFLTFSLALEHFTKTVWPQFKDKTKGICLYKGKTNFSEKFHWDEKAHENFHELICDLGKQHNLTPFDFHLFCANVFGEYLQRLISFLPDTVSIFTDFETGDDASSAFLLSKERFSHLDLGEEPKAICLPLDCYICPELLFAVDDLLESGKYRLIPEALLTEEWNGVEEITVFPQYVSPQGKRKLQGFAAAGGQIIEHIGDKI